ncbi:hypothetical protein [Virgibacillus sp. CBA3643]|uniref:hypothetical protein n=1 Tax=Virgibacillus sp. CBA3643 TaxID=2942278 RepID=UPI0035A30498
MRGNYKAFRTSLNKIVKNTAGKIFKAKIEEAWEFSEEEFYQFQSNEVKKIFDYARKHTPYYMKKKYLEVEINSNFDLEETLERLPILKKDELKKNNKDFWTNDRFFYRTFHTTSGTSGTPLKISGTLKERSLTSQNLKLWYQYLNGKKKQRFLNLSGFMVPEGNDLFWTDPVTKNTFLSIYDINISNRERIIQLLSEIKPTMIYGYASALNELANVIGESDSDTSSEIKLISTSEVLPINWRSNIESKIGEVYNLYGSQEGAHMALECKEHHLHINPLVGVVEILDENDNPVKEGELGKVVVTTLSKKSMPLIRYEIGDMAYGVSKNNKCDCGLHWPMIGAIQGREEDLVLKRNGSKIPLLSFHALKDLEIVKEGQLIQNGYENFDFRLVLKKDVSKQELEELENHIYNQMISRLKIKNIHVKFDYIDQLIKGPNGKFKSVEVRF